MNLAMVISGHINTDTGIRGHMGRDSLRLCLPCAERSVLSSD